MTPAQVVSGATRLEPLLEELEASAFKALIVDGGEREDGVVLLDEVREFGRDEQLQSVLIAADVSRKVPKVRPDTDLSELVQLLTETSADALLVTQPGTRTPVGVVTRAAIATLLLDWYAAELRSATPKRASGKAPRPS
jgi:predicted transcriptional regulator